MAWWIINVALGCDMQRDVRCVAKADSDAEAAAHGSTASRVITSELVSHWLLVIRHVLGLLVVVHNA